MDSLGMQENIPDNFQDVVDDQSNTMDFGILIDLVSKYPIIYNMGLKDDKNTVLKESCWQSIGEIMGQSAADCLDRWNKLKECYRREKRKRALETRSDSGLTNRRGFAYYQNMSFIENCGSKRRSYTNVSSSGTPPVKKPHQMYHNTPPYSFTSITSFVLHDGAQTYPGLTIPNVCSATPISSSDAQGLLSTSLFTSPATVPTLQSPPVIPAIPELDSTRITDPSPASFTSSAAPKNCDLGASVIPLTVAVSPPIPTPVTATPVLASSRTVSNMPSPTQPVSETVNQATAQTENFAIPEIFDAFPTPSTSPAPASPALNTLTNVQKRSSGRPILTSPMLPSPHSSRRSTPTSNYQYIASPSASMCSSPGPATSPSPSYSFNFDTPKACFNKDSVKSKKFDPLEASFISPSSAIQNRIQNPERLESGKNVALTSDQIFGNLIAAELNTMTEEQKIEKKSILEILFQRN